MNAGLSEMETRLLKLATRKLLDAFANLNDAAAACRVKPTNLSQYQSFEKTTFMPIDVIVALERAAGISPLTEELNRIHDAAMAGEAQRSVRDEALDVPVAVGELLAFVCEATGDNSPAGALLSENEKRRYFELRHRVEQELRELDEAVEKDGTLRRSAL